MKSTSQQEISMAVSVAEDKNAVAQTKRAERVDELLEASRSIAPILIEDAEDGERARSITPRVVDAMQQAGAFRMTMPIALGGLEADPVTQYEVIEALSVADGAAGWVAMIGSDAGYFAGRIPLDLAKELFPDPDLLSCGVSAPSGKAERVEGGYRVKGRWAFASCCKHATWFKGACVVTEKGAPVIGDGGRPEMRTAVLPIEDVEIVDNWNTTGLSGSSSNDIEVNDVFVPERRMVGSAMEGAEAAEPPGPLYTYWMMLMCNVAGVPMGIARRSIDEACAIANGKFAYGTKNLIRDEALLQMRLGRAETTWHAARAFLIETVEELWQTLLRGDELSLDLRSRFRQCNLHGFHAAQEVTQSMYTLAGSTALYRPHPLERAFRDQTVAANHLLVREAGYAEVGRVSLGIDPQSFVLAG
jgi:alkylation response protein AidB-like acyl-CoA dehydrogenase